MQATATVHHNSRLADCTISENQTSLKFYEVRVYIGSRGADKLHIKKGTEEIVVHRDNVDIHMPDSIEEIEKRLESNRRGRK